MLVIEMEGLAPSRSKERFPIRKKYALSWKDSYLKPDPALENESIIKGFDKLFLIRR